MLRTHDICATPRCVTRLWSL